MLIFQYVINSSGDLIYPSDFPVNTNLNSLSGPANCQVTLIYYNNITTNSQGVVTPINPVTTGLSGTIQIQARTTLDSAWSNVQDGDLNLASGDNMAFPAGALLQVRALCTAVTGCNYILIRMDMGA